MPSPIRIAHLVKVLERHGWTLTRISGSHHIFGKEGEPRHISVPVHRGQVGYAYVRDIEKKHGIRF